MLSLRNEVRGNKYEAVEYASFIVYTPYKVKCFHSCDSVECRFMKVSSYVFVYFGWVPVNIKSILCKNVIIKGLLLSLL